MEVVKLQGNRISLGIVAPSNVKILRGELTEPKAKAQIVELAVEDGLLVACETQKCLSRGYYLPPGFHYPDNLPEGHPGQYNLELPPYPVTFP